MANVNYVFTKTVRFTGWPLFLLVGMYVVTGYVLCGKYGLDRVIDTQTVLPIHKMFDVVLVVLLLAHALPAMYLAFRRWGWIR